MVSPSNSSFLPFLLKNFFKSMDKYAPTSFKKFFGKRLSGTSRTTFPTVGFVILIFQIVGADIIRPLFQKAPQRRSCQRS